MKSQICKLGARCLAGQLFKVHNLQSSGLGLKPSRMIEVGFGGQTPFNIVERTGFLKSAKDILEIRFSMAAGFNEHVSHGGLNDFEILKISLAGPENHFFDRRLGEEP